MHITSMVTDRSILFTGLIEVLNKSANATLSALRKRYEEENNDIDNKLP